MKALIEKYFATCKELENAREQEFPFGVIVYVDCSQYKGFGTVAAKAHAPLHLLPIELDNGDVWYYPLECCKRI